jgi:hypothetical protein
MQTAQGCGSLALSGKEVRMSARRPGQAISVVALAAAGLFFISPIVVAQAAKPDFSGVWELDTGKSDDAEVAIRDALGLTGGRGDRQAERQALSSRLHYLARAAETIEIEQTEKDIKLFNSEDDVRIHYIDGQKHPRQTPIGEKLTTVTVWRDNFLDLTTEGPDIGKVTETLGMEGLQLVHIVRIQNEAFEDDLVVRAYYDRAER